MDKHTPFTVLFIMHMPPPVHGASMVGKYIHDSKVINEAFDCHYINLTTADTLSDIGKIGVRKCVSFAKLLNKITKEIKWLRPDIVYITPNAAGGAFYKDFIVVETVKRLMRKTKGSAGRVVLHFHNKGVSTRQGRWLENRLYRRFFNHVNVMLLAESLYGDVAKYVPRGKVAICGNGIPDFPANVPVEDKTDKGTPHLLFLSNMMATKGVWELLDALCILRKKGLDFACDFVGGWKDIQPEEFHARVHAYGLSDCIHAHGAQYGMDKEEFFNRADIFVFPTYYHNECFPLVLLEAMMHGLACVSTNEGGISNIIKNEETGIIVERNNPRKLAEALESLLNNREKCKAMGQEGWKRYKQEFTLQRFEERFRKCMQAFAGDSSGSVTP